MRRPSADDTFEDLLRSLRNAAPKSWPKRDTPLKNAGGKSPSRSSPAVSPRRLALDDTDFAPLDPDPVHVDGDKLSRQVPRSISDPSKSGAVGVPTSRAVARQQSRDMFDEVFEKQAMERDRRMRSMGQIDFVLEELCRSTGFGYAEVWQRAHVRANDGMVSEGGAKHSVDLARMSQERRRRSSLDVVMDFFERRVNVLVRRSSQDTRRSADVARRVQHQLLQAGAGVGGKGPGTGSMSSSVLHEVVVEDEDGDDEAERLRSRNALRDVGPRLARMPLFSWCLGSQAAGDGDGGGGGGGGSPVSRARELKAGGGGASAALGQLNAEGGDGSNLGVHLGYDETLDHRLRWAGHHIYVPERFEESERLEHLGPGWTGRLEEFVTRASQKLSWYEKGKGFPGAAWARKKVVYRDLYFLPDDDFEAGDPRVRMAKDLFDISCGIPVLHPDSGQLLAVVMLYRVRCAREHRMNANWRRLHKHPGFRARINSAAHMAFWALRCAHLTCSSSMSRMQVY